MLIEWSDLVEIGDPVVDAEHRYLTQLINNLFEQHESGKEVDLGKVFTHLTKYIRVHFDNEEALMAKIGYPQLEEHRGLHRKIIQQCMDLGEEYLDDSESVTKDMFEFLRAWWVGHIGEADTAMKPYLEGERPADLNVTPAFAGGAGPGFKKCTMCAKSWASFEELAADTSKVVKGCQIDETNHLYNLIMFNCSCDTTLAVFLSEIVTKADIPFVITDHEDPSQRPSFCMKREKRGPCLSKCACAYTRQVLDALQ